MWALLTMSAGESPFSAHADGQHVVMTLMEAQGSSTGQQVTILGAGSMACEAHDQQLMQRLFEATEHSDQAYCGVLTCVCCM